MSPSAEVLLPGRDQASTTDMSTLKSNITTQIHEVQPPPPNTLVLHPSFVTQDFDLLRFSAAAQNQLPSPDSSPTTPNSALDSSSDTSPPDSSSPSPAYSTNLISSPYNTPGHYLSLSTLTPESRLFALALTALRPTRPDYATAPYTQALNFPTVISLLRTLVSQHPTYSWPETSFYVVTFHSKLAPDINQTLLYELDFESHREASESGGLLKYWFGKADLEQGGERRNLATCFWAGREEARRGGSGPWHKRARREGAKLYESIVFRTLRFVVEEGVRGWRVEEWVEGEGER